MEHHNSYKLLARIAKETGAGANSKDKGALLMSLGSWLEIAQEREDALVEALTSLLSSCADPYCDKCAAGKQAIHALAHPRVQSYDEVADGWGDNPSKKAQS